MLRGSYSNFIVRVYNDNKRHSVRYEMSVLQKCRHKHVFLMSLGCNFYWPFSFRQAILTHLTALCEKQTGIDR